VENSLQELAIFLHNAKCRTGWISCCTFREAKKQAMYFHLAQAKQIL
jgi:hypothetical protein